MKWSAIIYGQSVSKANRRQAVRDCKTGKPMFIKSAEALQYVEDAQKQLAFLKPARLLEGNLRFTATIFYRSARSDLDASALIDALQGYVYTNDRAICELRFVKRVDAKNPRAEIEVEEV